MSDKKFAVVVGGTSGLGLAMVIALKRSGYIVFTASRREESPESDYHVQWDATEDPSYELWRLFYEQLAGVHGGTAFDLIAYTVGAWSTGNFFTEDGFGQLEKQVALSMTAPGKILYNWWAQGGKSHEHGDLRGNPVFVMVSSTSAHVKRTNPDKKRESTYAGGKAGMSGLMRNIVADMEGIRAGRIVLVEPGGMASWFPESGMDHAKVAEVVLDHAGRLPEKPGSIVELIINRGEGNKPEVSLGPVKPYYR